MLDDAGHGRGDRRGRAQRRAPADRGVHARSPTKRWRAHLEKHGVPTLYRIHEEPDPAKVEVFEEFISTLGYSLAVAAEQPRAARFPEAGREDSRQAGREADCVPDAADDAEGALRPGEPRPLRPGGRAYTHFTSPIRRYPDLVVHRVAARVAPRRMTDERRAELAEDLPEIARAHVRARAARQRRRARAGAVEEGPLHGRQGRRRVRRLHHRRQRRSVSTSSWSSTSSRAWCTCRRWPTTTTGSSSARTSSRGENNGRVYRLGDRVTVQVMSVDLERRQIDLGPVEILDARAAVREQRRDRSRSQAEPRQALPGQAQRRVRGGQGPQAAARPEGARSPRRRRLTAMRSIVIGTAGHIDHGKSALVRALTGIDPDRLKEEQERGITIDLGFAHAECAGGRPCSPSSTCPGTSGSSRTCWPAPAASICVAARRRGATNR